MEEKKEKEVKKEKQHRCELCGRPANVSELEPDSRTGLLLCEQCLAEQRSCGCMDD